MHFSIVIGVEADLHLDYRGLQDCVGVRVVVQPRQALLPPIVLDVWVGRSPVLPEVLEELAHCCLFIVKLQGTQICHSLATLDIGILIAVVSSLQIKVWKSVRFWKCVDTISFGELVFIVNDLSSGSAFINRRFNVIGIYLQETCVSRLVVVVDVTLAVVFVFWVSLHIGVWTGSALVDWRGSRPQVDAIALDALFGVQVRSV